MIVGLTIDPVTAAAVAAGVQRSIPWPGAWTDALHKLGLGLDDERSPPLVGTPVLIHGGLAWSADHVRRAGQLGVDDSARGRVVARAVCDRWANGAVELDLVEPLRPEIAAGDAVAPWTPTRTLIQRIAEQGAGARESAPSAPANEQPEGLSHRSAAAAQAPNRTGPRPAEPQTSVFPGARRLWCARCWRVYGVELGERSVVLSGATLGVRSMSGRCGIGYTFCSARCAGGLELIELDDAEVSLELARATEQLTWSLLDRVLGGPIALGLGGYPIDGPVPVIDMAPREWIEAKGPPPRRWLGRLVAMRDRGAIVAVGRFAGHANGHDYVGQRPEWWSLRPGRAVLWAFDDIRPIEPLAWARPGLEGDGLLCVIERLRDSRPVVPWLQRPGGPAPRLAELLPDLPAVEQRSACAIAAAQHLAAEPAWGRWRLVVVDGGARLIGCGLNRTAPPAAVAWAALQRETLTRAELAPAPYPTGDAPAGRYLIVGADGPRLIDHPGGQADAVWIARYHQETP